MGLDLCVEGRALPGHEAEWEAIIRRSFAGVNIDPAEAERFSAISQPAYASLDAPRVGSDVRADDWIAAQNASRMSRDEAIRHFDGYHVLALTESDGLPRYSHGGSYEGVDETSFRGDLLKMCTHVLAPAQIEEAWENHMPDQAVVYGEELLAAASRARCGALMTPPKPSLLRVLLRKKSQPLPVQEQIDIVETAGRWFDFWGRRGHPIHANF